MGMFDPNQRGRMSDDGGNRPPGTGISGRLIIAGIIIAIGLFTYWNRTEQNPVTGEKQHVAITPDQEIRLGIDSAPQMAKEMGGELPNSDPRTQEVQRIGQLVVDHSDARKSPWQFQFHLLADAKTVNAFALPGGQIFITRGLYDKLQTEGQLAGVLGHEVGHVIERHTAQQMAKSQLGQWFIIAIGAASSDPNQGGGNSPIMIAAMVNKMLQLHYGREDESQADEWGIKLLEQSGYDPHAMIDVMNVLKEASGGGGGKSLEIFQTHPNPDLRIKQIEAYLIKHPPPPGLTQGKPLNHIAGSSNEQEEEESDDPLERLRSILQGR